MTKKKITEVKAALKKIEKTKDQIAALRDLLRDQVSDLEGVLATVDNGVESIETGLTYFADGIDNLSELL